MRVNIGPYKNWFGPYQLAEVLCFWVKATPNEYGIPEKPDWVHKFGEWLATGKIEPEPEVGEVYSLSRERNKTLLYRFLHWIHRFKQRRIYVHIDRWDTWNMNDTLAYIILPMLKQLKATQRGSPFVSDEDVPEHLRSTAAPPKENDWDLDDNHQARWDWVLDEMIFAFETSAGSLQDWEEQFRRGNIDFAFKKLENGMSEMVRGPNDNSEVDYDGMKEFQKRISNGFVLFGKYYESLWD